MTQNKFAILESFPAIATNQWEAVIQEDLKGADYEKKLVWKTDENLAVRPYYREENLNDLGPQLRPVPGQFPFVRGNRTHNHWTISQAIDNTRITSANEEARRSLARGAEAVCFHIAELGGKCSGPYPQSVEDLAKLLDGIDAPVSFKAKRLAESVLGKLFEAAHKGKIRLTTGTVDFDPLHDLLLAGSSSKTPQKLFDDAAAVVQQSIKFPGYRPLAVRAGQISESGGNTVQELAAAIAAGTEYLAELTERGLRVDDVAKALYFDLAIGANYFFEIAKLRVLRLLWAQIVDQFKPANKENARAFIVASTSTWDATVYDRHINLLRGTTKTMSAAIGGADVIETLSFDVAVHPSDNFSRRLARNTQIILKKESYFDRIVDPGAGSYYIETLTDSLAKEAWALFQKIEKEGGYLKAIRSGFIQREVQAARAKKDKGISGRSRNLLGTNQFPNGKETALDELKDAETVVLSDCGGSVDFTVTPLLPYRGSEGYEALRLATERYAAKGNKNPRFLLLEYGDLKMRKARSGFSLNFIACAGFDIEIRCSENNTPEAAAKIARESAADVVVLCSSDDEYLPMSKSLIQILGGTPVIVAGSPATMDQLKADGVADFIHVRSNVLEVLSTWQKKLGVTE